MENTRQALTLIGGRRWRRRLWLLGVTLEQNEAFLFISAFRGEQVEFVCRCRDTNMFGIFMFGFVSPPPPCVPARLPL